MKFMKFSLILCGILVFVVACSNSPKTENATANANKAVNNSTPQPTAPPDEFAAARKNYKDKNCVKCHKEDGTGGETDFDGVKIKVPDFKSDKLKAMSDEKFINAITNGDDEMPAFKDKLSAEEIKDLVKFIRKEIQGK